MVRQNYISNVCIKSRLKQLLILIVTITICILISQAVEAKDKHKKGRAWQYKHKYKAQIHRQHRECAILTKKHQEVRRRGHNPARRRTMAEVEE